MSYPRELRIRYGDLTVGGESAYLLDGYHEVRTDFEVTDIRFDLVVTGADEAEFSGRCREVESALRTPYQDLEVSLGGSVILRLRQSDDTGLDNQPEVVKLDDPMSTGRSRRYRVRIRCGRPADNVTTRGHRRSSVSVAYSSSRRRTVTIEGVFTSFNGTGARAQYESKIAALASAALTALGGTYELVGEPVTRTSTNGKTLEFVRVYEERIYGQGSSSLDDAALVSSVLEIRKRRRHGGHTPTATELVEIEATFRAAVDKTASTDLAAKWAAVKPWLVEKIRAQGVTYIAQVGEDVQYDHDNNSFLGTIRAMCTESTGGLLLHAHRVEVRDEIDEGKVFVPGWTGEPLDCYIYEGPRVLLRTVSQVSVYGGHLSPDQVANVHRDLSREQANDQEWHVVRRIPASAKIVTGMDGSEIQTTEVTAATVYRRAKQIGPTTVGGGSGGATTPTFGAVFTPGGEAPGNTGAGFGAP